MYGYDTSTENNSQRRMKFKEDNNIFLKLWRERERYLKDIFIFPLKDNI